MIIGFEDPHKYLYHYTKARTAIKIILKKRILKIGNFTSTNDPKETKEWEFSLGTNENRDFGKYNMGELSQILSIELKEKTKVICFSRDREPLSGDHLRGIFNRGFCKPRMWDQYADNHRGVCLIFEKERLKEIISNLFSNVYRVIHGDVVYIDRSVIPALSEGDYTINIDYFEKYGLKEYAKAHFSTFHKRLFFEKMIDWSNEDEFRWILLTDKNDDLYFNFKDALKGIVFGENTNKKDIDRIIDLTKDEIEYIGIKWKNCSPWYDFGNFKYEKKLRNSLWLKNK